MRPVYRSNLFALIVILGQILGTIFLSGVLYRSFKLPLVLILTQVLFLLVPCIIYLLFTQQSIKETLKLNRIAFVDILIVIAIAFLSQPVASFLSALANVFFKNVVNEVLKEINNIPYIVQLGAIALTPAICEEITMRGIVLSGYKRISSGKTALMTGLLFGILHLNPQQFLYAFVLGILFAYLVRITNSIFSSMICHFTFNGIQVTLSYVTARMKPELLKDSADFTSVALGDKISALFPLLFSAILFSWMIFLLVKKLDRLNRERRVNTINEYSYEINSQPYMQDEEMGYLLRGREYETEEKVVNFPFIVLVIVSVGFMVIVEFLTKR